MDTRIRTPRIRSFDDFRLGQRFCGGERVVTADDLASFTALSGDRNPLHVDVARARDRGFDDVLLQGPFGLAVFFGWFDGLDLARDAVIGLLDTNWRYLAPIHVGDRLSFDMTITQCRRTGSGDRGILGRHVRVIDQDATVVQEGETAVMLDAPSGLRRVGQELFTRAWAKRMAERLDADDGFRRATATWDGSFGVGDDKASVQFRIYRGKVIEAGERTPNGPNFTLHASALTWARLVSADDNLFMKSAMKGEFSVQGAAYDYLRFTRALHHMVDVARTLSAEEPSS